MKTTARDARTSLAVSMGVGGCQAIGAKLVFKARVTRERQWFESASLRFPPLRASAEIGKRDRSGTGWAKARWGFESPLAHCPTTSTAEKMQGCERFHKP